MDLQRPFRGFVAHDNNYNTPLCNLYLRMLHPTGIEAETSASGTGELSW